LKEQNYFECEAKVPHMINVSVASEEFIAAENPPVARHFLVGAAPRIAILGLSVWAGVWALHRLPHSAALPQIARAPAPVAAPAPKSAVAAIPNGALFDSQFYAGSGLFMPVPRSLPVAGAQPSSPRLAALTAPAPQRMASTSGDRIPSPRAHLADRAIPAILPAGLAHLALGGKAAFSAPHAPDAETMRKLFGGAETTGPALAYASAQSGLNDPALGGPTGPSALYDRWTAVYDVSAHTVYLPNGARLEAHSGLGNRLDDPSHAYEHNRGATPPHVYELASVDEPFHGVHALRLNPVGGGDVFGRDGLLAHSYMLGPKGDSNGCVAFKNYAPFLEAFEAGQVKRLAVVARLD
jgi:Protein of unknown function (DUF2778)